LQHDAPNDDAPSVAVALDADQAALVQASQADLSPAPSWKPEDVMEQKELPDHLAPLDDLGEDRAFVSAQVKCCARHNLLSR